MLMDTDTLNLKSITLSRSLVTYFTFLGTQTILLKKTLVASSNSTNTVPKTLQTITSLRKLTRLQKLRFWKPKQNKPQLPNITFLTPAKDSICYLQPWLKMPLSNTLVKTQQERHSGTRLWENRLTSILLTPKRSEKDILYNLIYINHT